MLNGLKARQRRRGRNSQKRKRPRLPLKRRIISSFSKIIMISRSEEHTSELQSLMRISYAVFCLKKKNNTHLHPKTGRIIYTTPEITQATTHQHTTIQNKLTSYTSHNTSS